MTDKSNWKLVPVEPTDEMLQALWEAMFEDKWDGSQAPSAFATYRAMLDAAPPPSAGVDAVAVSRMDVVIALREWFGGERYARDYEYLDMQMGPPMKATLEAVFKDRRARSALTPAPTPVELRCTICNDTGVTSQRFGMGTSPGECPVCSRAKPAPVDDGPFWDSPPGRWDDGDHNDEPYSETPTNPALVEARGEAINPAAMTERLIDAAIYAETASGAYVREARKEVNEARAAIEAALAKPAPAVEAVREALQTSLSEMLEARDRLLCYHARTSGLDHGIEEARRALAALAPAAQAGTVAQEGER